MGIRRGAAGAAAMSLIAGFGLIAAPTMPSWLGAYPGATPSVQERAGLLEATYTTRAQVAEVVEHYRKLFGAAGLGFQASDNGMGTTVRGAAPECDLLILITAQATGTYVDVNCTAPSPNSSPVPQSVEVIRSGGSKSNGVRPAAQPHLSASEMQAHHQQLVKELGIHPDYRDAPAPPLVWPSWFVHMEGVKLRPQQGVDQSKQAYLEARYVSTQPMSAIYKFYEDLLNGHEYRVHNSSLGTGHTISGIQQNASGYVEGTNYPDGAPGPRTVIHVSFSRFILNEPITVRLRITAYEFVAPKSRF